AAIADGRGKGEEQQVAAGNKGVRQSAVGKGDCGLAGQRRIAEPTEDREIDDVVLAELAPPIGKLLAQAPEYGGPTFQLHGGALAVIEADRLDSGKGFASPGEAGR